MHIVGCRLSDDEMKGLDEICSLTKRTKSSIFREALEQYIEDLQDHNIALKRLKQHKKDGQKTYTLEEVQSLLSSGEDDNA